MPPADGTTPPAGGGGGLSGVRVTGQALAAVTTAAAGGFLGGAGGTVAGAAVASVVTTVGEAIYQRSLERTRDRVRNRIDAHRTRAGRPADGATAVMGSGAADATRVAPAPVGTRVLPAGEPDEPAPDENPTVALTARPARSGNGKRVAVLAATGILIFLIAMVVVTGIERVKGSPLSGGQGTSIGEVFGTAPSTTTTSGSGDDDETTSARATESGEATSTRATTATPTTVTTTRSRGGAAETTLETPTP
ncbi:hypothetical protein [Actinomycetospora sp. TBRC 11914]|uniref:hypothetical protein n=1 Tax=Actinomycetospora sp. TBRC 11914 TaxID=2729387 RepID=UPI00145CD864|nr:hypothetical protein [Actinomycetospora sp. TBRC 11914]NMO89131.1 hypothetical protein [Actinomycetospora sp. TBRC 11914]